MIVRIEATTKRGFNLISRLIQKVQGTEYSHFGIIVKGFVLEANHKGTTLSRLEDFRKVNKTLKYWEFDIDVYPEVFYEWVASILGTKYGYVQNVGYLLMAMKLLESNPFGRNSNRIVCSEVVALFANKFLGADIEDSDQYDLIKTEALLEHLC